MIDPQDQEVTDIAEECGCPLSTYTQWMQEIFLQPAWRGKADREMDYYAGNQLDSITLAAQHAIGMPPAIEPLIGPTIDSILGAEAKSRTDWRVIPAGDKSGDEVAQAIGSKLNDAERHSKADRACSEAYLSQVGTGIGWVEVARESDPFLYPYRCSAVHRNEIWFDFLDLTQDLSKSRYLIRRKWMDRKLAAMMFPDKSDLIIHSGLAWTQLDMSSLSVDGGKSTDLAMAWNEERGWSIEEQQWRDLHNKRVCLSEVWYRDWQQVMVMKLPDGRVIEVDQDDANHRLLIMAGAKPKMSVVAKMRLAWYMGPHLLHDGVTPYNHNKFPYVPFWGKREDRTGVPFGLIRGMMYLQDEVNVRIAKMQWGLASTQTTRTHGAVAGSDERFRQEVSRVDADIILDQKHMALPGATFEVKRDFQLNEQQYKRLIDAREGIKRTGGIYSQFEGMNGTATSGVQFSAQVEQSNQNLADINDNFKDARTQVGDLLVSMIVEDLVGQPTEVEISGGGVGEDKMISLNCQMQDESTGEMYLNNDVERTMLKVVLEDVPSTPSYRTQQLAVMGESFKSAPPEYQKIMMPYLFSLMDVPNKAEMIEAIKALDKQPSPEEIDQRVKDEVEKALTKAMIVLKSRELDLRERSIEAEAVKTGVESQFASLQAGQLIATIPQISPVADAILANAGYQVPTPAGIDPNLPSPQGVVVPPLQVTPNTSPQFPAVPQQPESAMTGIETSRNDQAL